MITSLLSSRHTANAPARWDRHGFTFFEIVAALSILSVVLVITAQMSYQAMRERTRNDLRQLALEIAGNTLEAARAAPWGSLTPQWGGGRRLPESWKESQPDGELNVRVEPEAGLPQARRVTVIIRWDFREGIPPQELELTTLIAAREMSEGKKGP